MRAHGSPGPFLAAILVAVVLPACATITRAPGDVPEGEPIPEWVIERQREWNEARGMAGGEVIERVVTRELVIVNADNWPVAVLRSSPDRSGGWLRIKDTGGHNLIDLSASEDSVSVLVKGNHDDTGSWNEVLISTVNGRAFVSVRSMVADGPLGPIDAGASVSIGVGKDGRPALFVRRETGEVIEVDLTGKAE